MKIVPSLRRGIALVEQDVPHTQQAPMESGVDMNYHKHSMRIVWGVYSHTSQHHGPAPSTQTLQQIALCIGPDIFREGPTKNPSVQGHVHRNRYSKAVLQFNSIHTYGDVRFPAMTGLDQNPTAVPRECADAV